MEPLISIQLMDRKRVYQPADVLRCHCQIDAVESEEIQAVEASVLWYTEGKGDEDMSVAHFERRTPADAAEGDLRQLRELEATLPKSPLSYAGVIVKVRWCVRVRVFLRRGKETFLEYPFQLGDVPRGKRIVHKQPEDPSEQADDFLLG